MTKGEIRMDHILGFDLRKLVVRHFCGGEEESDVAL